MTPELISYEFDLINFETPVTEPVVGVPKFTPSKNRCVKVLPNGTIEYELFKVVDEYDSSLKGKTYEWDFENPPGDLNYIVISMIQTMMLHGGIGLSANQCGLPYKIFVMGTGQAVEVVINPIITSKEGEQFEIEGCLSSPGLFLKIKRAQTIQVKYTNLNKQNLDTRFEGLTARIFQHEFDHLEGIRFIDLVSKVTLGRAKDKVNKYLRRIKQARSEAFAKHKKQIAAQQQQQATIVTPTSKLANDDVIRFDVNPAGETLLTR